ncbi:hypothetical protein [Archangium lipolyticum]|uniref:hypothetical protein n=1 Tax=Archangium lipolyticum TaxID=2970465 RepID=UPI00214BB7B6|nr:hypothetical protein [Archangium lipolyticum]
MQDIGNFRDRTTFDTADNDRSAQPQDCIGLERTSVWDEVGMKERLLDTFMGRPNATAERHKARLKSGSLLIASYGPVSEAARCAGTRTCAAFLIRLLPWTSAPGRKGLHALSQGTAEKAAYLFKIFSKPSVNLSNEKARMMSSDIF